MDMSQEPFCVDICRENGRGHLRGQHSVRDCAVEMHMAMSQEAFCAEIHRCKIGSANTNLRAQRTKSKLGKSKQRPFSEAMA